jgi:DNA invertase Pin-like site-specific DNA recombinase
MAFPTVFWRHTVEMWWWADTATPHGRLKLTVLGGLAEFERELIRARTGEGRKRASLAARASSPPISARRPLPDSRSLLVSARTSRMILQPPTRRDRLGGVAAMLVVAVACPLGSA